MSVSIYLWLSRIAQLYSYMMLAWVLLSWAPDLRNSKVGLILGKLVDPYLAIFRRVIPTFGGIDFSPIVAFIVYRIAIDIIFQQILPLILPLR